MLALPDGKKDPADINYQVQATCTVFDLETVFARAAVTETLAGTEGVESATAVSLQQRLQARLLTLKHNGAQCNTDLNS